MARIRTIKPEFPQSESIGRLSRDARLLFIELWTIADDEGRTRAASRMLASLLFPYDDDAPGLIEEWLAELEREDLIALYEVDGSRYLEITKWLIHQKIDKPSRSRIPAFDESSRVFAKPRECSSADLGPRTMDLVPRTKSISTEPTVSVAIETLVPEEQKQPARARVRAEPPTAAVWAAYSTAYEQRYGTEPVRNATVNGQLAMLVKRLGADAPGVAAFYVGHDNAVFVRASHPVGLLLRDAEGLRTQWVRGRAITHAEAVQADRRQTTFNAFAGLIAEAEQREQGGAYVHE